MTVIAAIGANALLLLYVWLASAIIASFLSNKKGYGEKPGLASGLLLSAVAVVVWLLVPAKANSDWGRRKAHKAAGAAANPDVPAKPGPAD
jgi:hypothetical protein